MSDCYTIIDGKLTRILSESQFDRKQARERARYEREQRYQDDVARAKVRLLIADLYRDAAEIVIGRRAFRRAEYDLELDA